MNERSAAILRACRGPIFLISIGVLFALDHFTPYRITQTWPLLLIVMGLVRLLGGPRRFDELRGRRRYAYTQNTYPQNPPPPPSPDSPSAGTAI